MRKMQAKFHITFDAARPLFSAGQIYKESKARK